MNRHPGCITKIVPSFNIQLIKATGKLSVTCMFCLRKHLGLYGFFARQCRINQTVHRFTPQYDRISVAFVYWVDLSHNRNVLGRPVQFNTRIIVGLFKIFTSNLLFIAIWTHSGVTVLLLKRLGHLLDISKVALSPEYVGGANCIFAWQTLLTDLSKVCFQHAAASFTPSRPGQFYEYRLSAPIHQINASRVQQRPPELVNNSKKFTMKWVSCQPFSTTNPFITVAVLKLATSENPSSLKPVFAFAQTIRWV